MYQTSIPYLCRSAFIITKYTSKIVGIQILLYNLYDQDNGGMDLGRCDKAAGQVWIPCIYL